jgi:hypothetical protein
LPEDRLAPPGDPHVITERDLAMMREMLARSKRDGDAPYVGDPDTGRIERFDHPWVRGEERPVTQVTKPITPQPQENRARPREHRSRSRTRSARGSPDDPDKPPLTEFPPAEFRRQLRALGVSP